jgi:hypothetical protein
VLTALHPLDVLREILRDRLYGRRIKSEAWIERRLLTLLEEEGLIRCIMDLDWRGYALRLSAVEDMANFLLADRNARQLVRNRKTAY